MSLIQEKNFILLISGYNESNIKKTIKIIKKNSSIHNIIPMDSEKEKKLYGFRHMFKHDTKEIEIYSMPVKGNLSDVKNLVRTDTPRGVRIELLPVTKFLDMVLI